MRNFAVISRLRTRLFPSPSFVENLLLSPPPADADADAVQLSPFDDWTRDANMALDEFFHLPEDLFSEAEKEKENAEVGSESKCLSQLYVVNYRLDFHIHIASGCRCECCSHEVEVSNDLNSLLVDLTSPK